MAFHKNSKLETARSTHTLQSRLARIRDRASTKLTDFTVKRTGLAANCPHLKIREDKNEDEITITITNVGNVNVIFTKMLNETSIKYLWGENGEWCFAQLLDLAEEKEPYELLIPNSDTVKEGDVIVRVMLNDNNEGKIIPILLPFKITEIKAMMGHNGIIHNKYYATYYIEGTTDGVKELLVEIVNQRLELNW